MNASFENLVSHATWVTESVSNIHRTVVNMYGKQVKFLKHIEGTPDAEELHLALTSFSTASLVSSVFSSVGSSTTTSTLYSSGRDFFSASYRQQQLIF